MLQIINLLLEISQLTGNSFFQFLRRDLLAFYFGNHVVARSVRSVCVRSKASCRQYDECYNKRLRSQAGKSHQHSFPSNRSIQKIPPRRFLRVYSFPSTLQKSSRRLALLLQEASRAGTFKTSRFWLTDTCAT